MSPTPRHATPTTPSEKPEGVGESPPQGSEERDRLRARAEAAIERLTPKGAVVSARSVLLWGCALGLLVVIAFAVLGAYTASLGSDVADFAGAEAVAANRVKAVSEVRGYPGMPCPDPMGYTADTLTLECANRFVVAVGGVPVPDPGDAATPTQMGAAVARALSRFDRALERVGKGAPPSAVSTPAPSGRFPGTR